MNAKEKYRKAIASRPSNEELKYWATLDTRAAEKTKAIFLAELDARRRERSADVERIIAEYNATREAKSNGTSFEKWSEDFIRYLTEWYEMPTMFAPMVSMQGMYDKDMTAGVAALTYAEECGWETELDQEIKEQRDKAAKLMEAMSEGDKMHQIRMEAVRCGLVCDGH